MKVVHIDSDNALAAALKKRLNDTVWEIAAGAYRLPATIDLSGVKNFTLHGNGGVTLEGGARFAGGFTAAGKNVYTKKLGVAPFRRLFAEGKELPCCRLPRAEESGEKDLIRGKWDLEKEELLLPPDCLDYVQKGIEIDALVAWIHCVDRDYEYRVEEDGVVVLFSADVRARVSALNRCMSLDYLTVYFKNHPAFLSRHGDWCYDRASGSLWVYWTKGDIETAEFLYPCLETLLYADGCENIHVAGVEFRYSNWTYPAEHALSCMQSTMYEEDGERRRPPAAVQVRRSSNVYFNRCAVTYSAATAFDAGPFCRNVTLEDSRVTHAGGNALTVGYFAERDASIKNAQMPYLPESLEEVTDNVRILNNEIAFAGECDNSGTGIAAGFCRNLYIEHNDIHDTAYSGIAAGWGWRTNKPFSVITNFQIRFNRIVNYLNSHFYDGAGIYILGGQSGEKISVIEGNYIAGESGLGMLYLDEGASYCEVKNNVLEGDAVHGLLYCHDIGNDLHHLRLLGNYGVRDYVRTDFHMDPEGPSQEERNIVCDGLKVFNPEKKSEDPALWRIVQAAGRR